MLLPTLILAASSFGIANAGWVSTGGCTVSGSDNECVASPNYPSLYWAYGSCSINWDTSVSGTISVKAFSTEEDYDFLNVDGTPYSGPGYGLDGSTCYGTLSWSSDSTNEDTGWKICLTNYGSGSSSTDSSSSDSSSDSSSSGSSSDSSSDDSSSSSWSWSVSGTGCQVDSSEPECLMTQNYPSSYAYGDSCSAYMATSDSSSLGYVQVTGFYTESTYDYLAFDYASYSGTGSGLNGHAVTFGTLSWHAYAYGTTVYTGWRICIRNTLGDWYDEDTTGYDEGITTTYSYWSRRRSNIDTAEEVDDSSSSVGFIVMMTMGPLVSIILLVVCCRVLKARQQASQPAVMQWSQAGPAPTPIPVTSLQSNPVVTSKTSVVPDNGNSGLHISVQCGQCRTLVKIAMTEGEQLQYTCPSCGALNQFSVTSPAEKANDTPPEAEVPSYWTTARDSGKNGFVTESDSTKRAVQTLLDKTWKNQITRDRQRGSKVQKFEVVMVHRNENFQIWDSFARTRRQIEEMCDGCDEWTAKTLSEEVYEDQDAADFLNRAELKSKCNEFYLFHGTKPSAAKAICDTDFLLKLSGSNAGTLYGPGLYFAEASSKSDEYAEEDKDGIFSGLYAMLVCRVVCGNINYTDQVRPKVQDLVNSILTDKTHHAVLGDREKCRGTYREFIVFDKDQVYPEFAIIYRRIDAEETKESE